MNIDKKIADVVSDIELDNTPHNRKVKIYQTQNLDHVAESAKADRLDNWNGWSHERSMRKIGTIPMVFLSDERYKDLNSDDKKIFEKATRKFFTEYPQFRTCNNNF